MTLGEDFAHALAKKDAAALKLILRPTLDFQALTPRRFWEETDAAAVVDQVILGQWFPPPAHIREVLAIESTTVGARERVGYRFRVENADGQNLVEQQAYYETDGSRIGWLRVMCAGYQPFD